MRYSPRYITITVVCLNSLSMPALGQEPSTINLEQVTVTATRSTESISSIPGAVTVVTRKQVEEQMKLSRDLGDMLGKLIPGLSSPTQSQSMQGFNLRGRKALVLIDGIPQNATRDTLRNLTTIHPSAIERIEVLPGATAIYGESAAGGIISIITKSPGEGPMHFTTDSNFNFSLSHPDDSPGGLIRQEVSGKQGIVDYSLSGAFEHVGGFFDADGDRISPDVQGSLSDTNSHDLFGKFGLALDQQRLQLSINHLNLEQDTEFVSDPSVAAFPLGEQKARALKGLKIDDQQGSENTLVSLDYHHADLLGSRIHAQGYYRDYLTRFGPSDSRKRSSVKNIIQSRLESEKLGGRLEIETPFPKLAFLTPTLLWGVDYSDEETSQPAALFDGATFDKSGGLTFQKTGERLWVPVIKSRDLGLFAQLETHVSDYLTLRAGLRHERIWVDVPGFTTIVNDAIKGGELNFEDTLYNAGAVLYITDAINVFANFSQGFSLTDIGLFLRQAPKGFSLQNGRLLDTQKVDNYEMGVRGEWSAVQVGLTGFYNESDLGATIQKIGNDFIPARAPERIYGFDASLDIQPTDGWRLGGIAGWIEGENNINNGGFKALDGFRIQPLKLTGYIEHETVPSWHWRNRLQVLYSGNRDRAFKDLGSKAFGSREVDDYVTLDWISSLRLGPGTLSLGVENLLNKQYFPVTSQLIRTGDNTSFIAARGAVFNIGYSLSY